MGGGGRRSEFLPVMDESGRRRRTDQSPVLDGQRLGLDGSGRVWTLDRPDLQFRGGEESERTDVAGVSAEVSPAGVTP